jgi:hypothetical protein
MSAVNLGLVLLYTNVPDEYITGMLRYYLQLEAAILVLFQVIKKTTDRLKLPVVQ